MFQQPFADLVSNAVFRDPFDDHPDKQIVGIAISIAFPGESMVSVSSPIRQAMRGLKSSGPSSSASRTPGVVSLEQAAAHVAELAHGDALSVRYGNTQREAAERIVETEFFFSATNCRRTLMTNVFVLLPMRSGQPE